MQRTCPEPLDTIMDKNLQYRHRHNQFLHTETPASNFPKQPFHKKKNSSHRGQFQHTILHRHTIHHTQFSQPIHDAHINLQFSNQDKNQSKGTNRDDSKPARIKFINHTKP